MNRPSPPPLVIRETGAGERVLLCHGSFSDAEAAFAAQAELADRYRLLWLERRGAGKSPSAARVDFEQDADDLTQLLHAPAHLVAHSYGAIGALLAAMRRPEAVLSLTLIEPPFYRAALQDPIVARLVSRLELVYRDADPARPDAFWQSFRAALGFGATPSRDLLAWWEGAARAAMTERPPWEAELPLIDGSSLPYPRCVATGDWSNSPRAARELGGRALQAVADALAAILQAERVVVPGASHNPQRRAEVMNPLLRRLFAGAARSR